MTKQEIIEETANFYNSNNRGTIDEKSDSCAYLTAIGTKCAVGRVMTDKALEQWGSSRETVYSLAKHESIDHLIEEKYHGHDATFWRALQSFHDNSAHWNTDGLTEYGLNAKTELIKRFC